MRLVAVRVQRDGGNVGAAGRRHAAAVHHALADDVRANWRRRWSRALKIHTRLTSM